MNIRLISLEVQHAKQGKLIAVETNKAVPFEIKRIFYVYDMQPSVVRGQHAHKDTHEVLVCLRGSCRLKIENGSEAKEFILDSPEQGIYIGPMLWVEYSTSSHDTLLLVIASTEYDNNDRIENYLEFIQMIKK